MEFRRVGNWIHQGSHIRELLWYLPNENDLYLIIPNSENTFIHNIQYSIQRRKPEGRMYDLPKTIMGAPFQAISLKCCVPNKGVWAHRGVQSLSVTWWRGYIVSTFFFLEVLWRLLVKCMNLGFRTLLSVAPRFIFIDVLCQLHV